MESSNQKNPLISVIVPIYNVEKYLRKCIESILLQHYKNLEVILVDDGSPDNCGAICDEYAKKDSRVRVIHKENGGLSSARNAGIDAAKGDYIGFIDSDDTIESFMYQKLMDSILVNDTKISVCTFNYIFDDGKKLAKPNLGEDRKFDFYHAMIEMNSHRLFDMGACTKLFSIDLFNNIRFPEGKLSEDFYIMYKIFDKAQYVSYVATPCYNYFQRKNSITHNTKINHDHEYAAKEQMEYLNSRYPDLNILGHTAYASAALTVYDSYLKNNVICPKNDLKHFKEVVKDNKIYIEEADFLSKSKKIQFRLFLVNTGLYNTVFKFYRKIKRV